MAGGAGRRGIVLLWAVATALAGVGAAVARHEPSSPELAVESEGGAPAASSSTSTTERSSPDEATTSTSTTPVPPTTTPTTTPSRPATPPTSRPAAPPEATETTHGPQPAAPAASSGCADPQPTTPPPFTYDNPVVIPVAYGAEVRAWMGQGMACWLPQATGIPGPGGEYHWRTDFLWPPSVRFDYKPTGQAWLVDLWWDGTTVAHSIAEVPYEPIGVIPGSGMLAPSQLGGHHLIFDAGSVDATVEAHQITATPGNAFEGWQWVRGVPLPPPGPTVELPILELATGRTHTVTVARNPYGEVFARLD